MTYGKKSLSIAAAATGVLLAAGGGTALGSAHAPHARAALISTPTLNITIATHHKQTSMTINGPRTFSAGRVNLTLKAVGGEQEVGIARAKAGYSFKQAVADFGAFESSFGPNGPSQAGLRALRRSVHNVVFYGGLDTGSLGSVSGSVVLPKAGHYVIFSDEGGPSLPHKLTVTKRVGNRATPKVGAKVWAITAKRFRGATTLPANGTIQFHNASTSSPHFLVLQHVKEGTTRKQVVDFVQSGSQTNPSFGLPDNVDSDTLGMGQTMTLTYKLPPGEYVEMCFFPDLRTGMPHAAMGMVRVVHLVK